jgi:hypothetical protein
MPKDTVVNIVSVGLHMHTLGRRIWVETTRDGKRLFNSHGVDVLTHDDYFSFNSQRFDPARLSVRVHDKFTIRCVFENTVAAGIEGGNENAAKGLEVPGCEASNCEVTTTVHIKLYVNLYLFSFQFFLRCPTTCLNFICRCALRSSVITRTSQASTHFTQNRPLFVMIMRIVGALQ